MARAEPANAAFYAEVTSVNQEYEASSQRVLERFQQGDIPGATSLHLNEEHPTSHELEASMRALIATANEDMTRAQADFQNSRTFFTAMVVAFSATSVIVALLLGFVLSWAFVIP